MAKDGGQHKAKPTYNHKLARSARRKGRGPNWREKVRMRERRD